jgi:hypothetical protein
MRKVCLRFDNPPKRRFLPFGVHEITSQQFFSDGNRILLIKSLRKNHDQSNYLTLSAQPTEPARQGARMDPRSTVSHVRLYLRGTP